MDKLICLRETWRHHAAVSGFDPLFTAIEQHAQGRIHNYFVPKTDGLRHLWSRMWRILKSFSFGNPKDNGLSPFVQEKHEVMCAQVIRCAKQHPDTLVLLSAGENQFGLNFVAADEAVRRRTVVCLHQPPSWLRLHWRDFSALDGLGAIICLSREQKNFLSGVCKSPTILIRHGVRHNFFRPPVNKNTSESSRLLFVGHWLRDFETLAEAMQMIWREQPKACLDCVIPRNYRSHPALLRLARDPRVNWHADIAPETLRDLYQTSTLLFMPLIDSTANNSIVEAMASGLPVVTTKVGGIADYVPEVAGELCPPGDVAAHAQAVLSWLAARERLDRAAGAGRAFAKEHLDWAHIAKKLIKDFEKLSLWTTR